MNGRYTLGEIAQAVGAQGLPAGAAGREVSAFSMDSRTIKAGELFVAVVGENFDGRKYVRAALERGAAGALVGLEAGLNGGAPEADGADAGAPVIRVPDAPAALQRLAGHHRQRIGIPVVAVTGTNGKTTTKDVIAHVLGAQLTVCATVGNLNSQLGMPMMVLNRMTREHRVGVFEVGMSAPGEIARLCAVLKPERGVVTSVGAAHTQFLGSVENVFEAKSELVDALPADGRLYLNREDKFQERMAKRCKAPATRVSIEDRDADLFLDVQSVDLTGVRGALHVKGDAKVRKLWMPIPGRHMAYPALFALAVARDLSLDLDKSLEALATCAAAKHRMQVVGRGAITILADCYNANPPSTEALIEFVRGVPHEGRKVLVLGDMLELGDLSQPSHRKVMERVLGEPAFAKALFVGPIYREASAGLPALGEAVASGRVMLLDSHEPALAELKKGLKDGDLVILKASNGIGLHRLVDQL